MDIKNLVPWRREKNNLPIHRENDDPFYALQRAFDDFWSKFDGLSLVEDGFNEFSPRIDVVETEDQFKVTAELPGMDEKDIDVTLSQDRLVIKGEKKVEKEDKSQNCYHMERSYGSFIRTIPLPVDGVENDKVEADFNKGVLTISLPKSPQAQKLSKRIPVKSA